MGSRMEKGREVGIEPTETDSLLTGVHIAFHQCSVQVRAVPDRSRRTPILLLSLSVFSWARGERLPVKVGTL